ncbi:protelomerase family protein [Photobacterium leiognathi]|uniref:protelomerase family protein n=1 Tax=Photobacterium leiognathi TaxID=553611 RepID=UPI002981BF05|nr:protelomerase family protein [Photobacterium leiognathi]
MKKVVGLNAISEWLISELKKIEKEDLTLGRKNQKIKRICERAKRDLWVKVDKSKPDGNQDLIEQKEGFINESTYNSYLTRLRRRIGEAGVKSLTLDKDFDKLLKDCKELKSDLKKVDLSTSITIRTTIKPLKDMVLKAGWWKSYKITEKRAESISKLILGFSGDNKAVLEHLTRDTASKDRTKQRASIKKKQTETLKNDRKLSVIKTIELATLLCKSRNWEYLAIGLGFATGRRSSEILHFGTFEALDKSRFKFTGQRKNKHKQDDVNTLPCLIDSKLVVESVERLRAMPEVLAMKKDFKKNESEAEIALKLNNRSHGKLCSSIDELMSGVYEDLEVTYHAWVFKDTRSAYAHTAMAMLEAREESAGREFKYKGDKLGKYYFQQVLLHSSDKTSELYEAFSILESKTDLKRYHIDKARKRGEKSYFESRTKLLKEWLEEDISKPYEKLINWCVDAIAKDPLVVINTSILRKEAGGRATTISDFVKDLNDRKLNAPDLILVVPEKEEEQTVIKRVYVTYTLTIEREIDVKINPEEEDEDEAIQQALNNDRYELDIDEAEISHDYYVSELD